MKFITKPYEHQLEGLNKSEKLQDLALFWEQGCGKTKGMIDILRSKYYYYKGLQRTLIISPLVTLQNWKREFGIHSTIPEKHIVVLNKSGKKRMKDFVEAVSLDNVLCVPKIVIINYEALQSKELTKAILEWRPSILVCDESHLLKNYKSLRAKTVYKISKECRHRYILTGTPILNTALDIFQQFLILDGGETFGQNFFTFRATYFIDENGGWSNKPGHFPKFVEKEDTYEKLHGLIYKKALRVLKDDCLDLPPLIEQRVDVPLGKEQARIYKEMKKDFIAFIEDKAVTAQVAVTKALRLQQIVSGYAMTEDKKEVDLKDNPRLATTKELLEQLTPNHKVILWCSFKNNYKQLSKICDELGILHVFLTGEQSSDEKQESMDKFNNEKNIRVIIANRRAGGIGINLVAASYSIVYSRNFSLGEENQSKARNHRGGSEIHEKIVKIDLVASETIDELVLEALQKKQNISDKIVEWKTKL